MLRRRQVKLLRKYEVGIWGTDIVSGAETEKCGVVVMQLNFPAERREVSDSCTEPKGEIERPANISHQAPFPP